MALATPAMNEMARISHTVMIFRYESSDKMKANAIMVDCVIIIMRRGAEGSAITRPTSEKKSDGTEDENPTSPRRKTELLSCSTSQPCAKVCIQLPMLERKLPVQKRRYGRCRSAASIPRRGGS